MDKSSNREFCEVALKQFMKATLRYRDDIVRTAAEWRAGAEALRKAGNYEEALKAEWYAAEILKIIPHSHFRMDDAKDNGPIEG
jgi:hypothetical protein